jgi:CubicO group peptidase (beta-lactamase class C family)
MTTDKIIYDKQNMAIKLFLGTLFFLISVLTYAQKISRADELFIDSITNANYNINGPGVVILVAKKGVPVFKKAYGLANIELNVKNKPEYLFNIGSMSKQFTSLSILKLAQEGKLNLTDDIKKYLPDYNTQGRKITIENILRHTSGIFNYTNKGDFLSKSVTDITKDDLKKSFMNDSLVFEPKTNWNYCNSGYVLAALIVEKVSGKSLDKFLSEQIFKPCEMNNTYLRNDDSIYINSASCYEEIGDNKFMPANYISSTYAYGAGGIISTVDDLLKYNNALLSGQIINKELLEFAWTPYVLLNGQSTNYGLGWAVGNYKGLKYASHGGSWSGFKSYGVLFPTQQLYVVILSNTNSFSFVSYCSSIAFRAAGQQLSIPKKIKPDNKTLQEYNGIYFITSPEFNLKPMSRQITTSNDTLYSQIMDDEDEKTQLVFVDKDFFTLNNSPKKFQFIRDKKGKIISLEVYNEPIQYGPRQTNIKTNKILPNK